MTARGYFVAGTDTGVGKTYVTCGLINGFRALGVRAGGMKPVLAGDIGDDLGNIDAVSGYSRGFTSACTYRLPAPVAPFIAAKQAGKCIEVAPIVADFLTCTTIQPLTVVEGTGGWLCPISSTGTMADVARALDLPVVLVVGLRLGCLNHALLTAAAIRETGLPLAGWVANAIDAGFQELDDNMSFLEAHIDAPLLASLPCMPGATPRSLCLEQAAQLLSRC